MRPRRDDQDVLLSRIASALNGRQSLAPWTLTEIAPCAGLSPAGLLKRFGSRQAILAALSRRWIESIPETPSQDRMPQEELRSWVSQRVTPSAVGEVARGLVNLLDDLADEQLSALRAQGWAREINYVAALLSRLLLSRLGDPQRGARLLFDCLNGAALRQAVEPHSSDPLTVLDDLLEAWT